MGTLHSVIRGEKSTKSPESKVKESGRLSYYGRNCAADKDSRSLNRRTSSHQVDSNLTRVPNNSQSRTDSLGTDPSLVESPLDTTINSRGAGRCYELKKSQRPSRDADVRRTRLTDVSPAGGRKKNSRPRRENSIQRSVANQVGDQVTQSKFIQAGVGYAFMRDNETNTIQPIFPNSTPVGVKKCVLQPSMVTPCLAPSQAYGDEGKVHDDATRRKQTEAINKMLNDPDDRRIRTICERFQCDLDIYAKNLIGGFMQYTVDIAAPNASNLLGCAKNLDLALGWHIAQQLNHGNSKR
ncbi:unnamed protein product [Hydatigera taeniaeformis]|uniref:DUF4780 domain-containing protein n=1 Tax=Hydatigena taeniaeformis TaxID=6205 RepID=A0A0R3WTH5_HYDTA|nr:unnamed protein product [Hydatigera taeniaeformis]